ncbi:MAG: four helix bundle protein [Flavobacteriales bacterium]|nr:four helix bundle protein [Flavobacteriales bacterium]
MSRDFAVEIHRATEGLDESDKHDLLRDIRRDCINTMSQIALGTIHKNPEFIDYLSKATS